MSDEQKWADSDPVLLNPWQLGNRLGIPPGKVHRLADEGALPFVTIGRHRTDRRFIFDQCVEALKLHATTASEAR